MSPFSTFQSCGSSSSEDLRISRPTGVMRGSDFSFWVAAQGALVVYVLMIWFYARTMNRLDEEFGVAEGD